MVDKVSKEKRSQIMSQVKPSNTKPEQYVRKYLFSKGFRYRKNVKNLSGKPDIVLPKYKTVVFVNGCFWHLHECQKYSIPQSNEDYWLPKLEANKERDKRNISHLEILGWKVIVVWECELRKKTREERMEKLCDEIVE